MNLTEIPHLTTAHSGPLHHLEKNFLENQIKIETWFRRKWQQIEPPFYASVDLRNSGFKLAPVDTNLFPAGFNNLNPEFYSLCIHAVQTTLERLYPKCNRILLIPESHTRNTFYLQNVAILQEILQKAGFDVRLGSLLTDLTDAQIINLPNNRQVILQPIIREGDRLGVNGFKACLVLLNHDLSEGVPDLFKDIVQPIVPSLKLGWAERLKSVHFFHYEQIANEFAELLQIDPWWITPIFQSCQNVDFQTNDGLEKLQQKVNEVFADIKAKYEIYNIQHKPFVVVKADNGTYGMGVLMLHEPDELQSLNRKERSRMMASKGGKKISKVIIQEGIYTFETIGPEQAVAEPVVYMIGKFVVGGFYRVHVKRDVNENLNAPGMHFEPLAFATSCNNPSLKELPDCNENRFYAYGVVARLALLAAGLEMQGVGSS